MTRKSSVVYALAAAPLLGSLLLLSGCGSQSAGPVPQTTEDRNEKMQASMEYMRKQQESKKSSKR